MKKLQDVYVIDAKRTAVAKTNSVFSCMCASELLSYLVKYLHTKHSDVINLCEEMIIGCPDAEFSQQYNMDVRSNFPWKIPAISINSLNLSSLQAISYAADQISLGNANFLIAGGVDCMTQSDLFNNHFSLNTKLISQAKQNINLDCDTALDAELIAEKYLITREQQDEFAFISQQKSLESLKYKYFKNEVVPVIFETRLPGNNKIDLQLKKITVDELPNPDISIETLSKLIPVFKKNGTITRGNSAQKGDGAAVLLLASKKIVQKYDLIPLAKFKGFAMVRENDSSMYTGSAKAIKKVLKKIELSSENIDWFELYESSAAMSLAAMRELSLDDKKINLQGGAIALGDPGFATGAIKIVTLLHGLRRKSYRYGIAAMDVGRSFGAASVFEAV